MYDGYLNGLAVASSRGKLGKKEILGLFDDASKHLLNTSSVNKAKLEEYHQQVKTDLDVVTETH